MAARLLRRILKENHFQNNLLRRFRKPRRAAANCAAVAYRAAGSRAIAFRQIASSWAGID
jgi:hypothetical protein